MNIFDCVDQTEDAFERKINRDYATVGFLIVYLIFFVYVILNIDRRKWWMFLVNLIVLSLIWAITVTLIGFNGMLG
jgi:hypothetical protein